MTLFEKVKANLMLEHDRDDELVRHYITAALRYAEGYQHKTPNLYNNEPMPETTEQAVIILASHFYESRDGSTGGFFSDNVQAAKQTWETVHLLLSTDKDWVV